MCRVEKAAEIRRQWTGEMLQSTETQSIKLPARSPLELAEMEQQGGNEGKRLTSEMRHLWPEHSHVEAIKQQQLVHIIGGQVETTAASLQQQCSSDSSVCMLQCTLVAGVPSPEYAKASKIVCCGHAVKYILAMLCKE